MKGNKKGAHAQGWRALWSSWGYSTTEVGGCKSGFETGEWGLKGKKQEKKGKTGLVTWSIN